MEYLRSLKGHLWTAFVDVTVISLISLAPLLLARLEPFASPNPKVTEPFWGFLTNGQLAFYSMGSLAVMLLAVFRKKLPVFLNIFVGLGSLFALLFLAWLVGHDPRLQYASLTFVGVTTLYIYIVVQIFRVLVDAVKQIDAPDALRAGERTSRQVRTDLAARKGVVDDD